MIHNAWHFQFKFGFCVYGGMVKFRVSVAHTLMRRYILQGVYMKKLSILSLSFLILCGCASKQEVYLTQSPIKVEQHDLGDYWVQSSEDFRFSLKSNIKVQKQVVMS